MVENAEAIAAYARNRQLTLGEYESVSGLINQILDWTTGVGTYADTEVSTRVDRGPDHGMDPPSGRTQCCELPSHQGIAHGAN